MKNLQKEDCLYPPVIFMLFGAGSGNQIPNNVFLQMNGSPMLQQNSAYLLQMESP